MDGQVLHRVGCEHVASMGPRRKLFLEEDEDPSVALAGRSWRWCPICDAVRAPAASLAQGDTDPVDYVPFDGLTPAHRRARNAVRERLAGLQVEGGQILKAVYHRDRPQGSDIENVLLYNIGGAALNRALGRGVVCEQAPLRLEVTGPAPALRVEDLKKICDGVVSALGAQSSDRDLTEVGHRIGSRLDLDGQPVRSALTDLTRAPLGVKARLAWLRADSVQWGPADDRCMAFEMTFTSGDRWRLSGSAHEVTGRRS